MRGWWSTRPKAKIWDGGGAARAFERRDDPPAPTPPAPAATPPAAAPTPSAPAQPAPAVSEHAPAYPGPAAMTPPTPAPPAPSTAPQLAALFPPRPDDFLPRETRVEEPPAAPEPAAAPITESPYYERTALAPADPTPASAPAPAPALGADTQGEFLRLLEVVTSMCDHVIEYIEADRAERRLMMETLTQLGRVITEGSAAAVAAFSALTNANAVHQLDPPSEASESAPSEPWAFTRAARAAEQAQAEEQARERIIGGSMPAGPEPRPAVEVVAPEPEPEPEPEPVAFIDLVAAESSPSIEEQATLPSAKIHIAVEVRGRFGDRWVDGFEICEVMTTPAGPRYRLRRQRDGVVLPELFDASNIRHVETPETAPAAPTNGAAAGAWSAGESQASRERSMGSHPSGSGGDSAPVNGSGYWSRS